jgi:hypothetical protein
MPRERDTNRSGSTQKTRPEKGKPIEVPIPTHKEVEDLMRGVAGQRPSVAKCSLS